MFPIVGINYGGAAELRISNLKCERESNQRAER